PLPDAGVAQPPQRIIPGPPMLQAIRSQATSIVVKILFGLLILTFGIWGIGDIFRNRSTDTTVARVGGRAVSAQEVSQALRKAMDRLRGMFGGSLDLDQAKQIGLVDNVVQRMISGDLIDLEIDRLGLAVAKEAVDEAIVNDPNFRGDGGRFD